MLFWLRRHAFSGVYTDLVCVVCMEKRLPNYYSHRYLIFPLVYLVVSSLVQNCGNYVLHFLDHEGKGNAIWLKLKKPGSVQWKQIVRLDLVSESKPNKLKIIIKLLEP